MSVERTKNLMYNTEGAKTLDHRAKEPRCLIVQTDFAVGIPTNYWTKLKYKLYFVKVLCIKISGFPCLLQNHIIYTTEIEIQKTKKG